MISFLSNWVQKIGISVIIVSIFELILPNGNLKKYIKVVLGIYIIFCIISPFVNNSIWNNLEDFDLEDYVENVTDTVEVSSNFEIEELYIDELKNDIKTKIELEGYKVDKCEIKADLSKTSKNPGIHEITLIVSNKESKIEDINIVLPKLSEKNIENKSTITNEEKNRLKQILSTAYEISEDIINIK